MTAIEKDRDILARTLWGEARGEGLAGQFAQAQRAADQVIAGTTPDPTGGATHYYATTMPKAPAWAAKAKQTVRIGQHVFFKDVP
ncbi:cell wall hydrolase [Pseudomonas chlororaphis subsp. piscium]|nr:cell wall hydrolase [Pseudomonas chlororaphis subsp. piscium]